jgi:hypothetical protein
MLSSRCPIWMLNTGINGNDQAGSGGLSIRRDRIAKKSKTMKQQANWKHMMYFIGIIAFLLGVLDPLEGSVVITLGSLLLALSTYLMQDQHWKIFLASLILIVVGVFFMFYFSSLGGFGGTSELSWWWGILILPYPLGWLTSLILLIVRGVHRRHEHPTQHSAY